MRSIVKKNFNILKPIKNAALTELIKITVLCAAKILKIKVLLKHHYL